ncbi:hypothetical protein ROZALSC1DRAFT_26450 [Rozella allomycis CSF55]|uniref:tRNA wybutosine-synthesizing protein 4 n=1 Tax=Rozella allomycis (strain CSF55) TaxID=988480 RepID=A0A4P9YR11_ROZAC|nr:hypothetical protein ROZALSC1DRAFT_26450 [Rozella allomycis CSF55]
MESLGYLPNSKINLFLSQKVPKRAPLINRGYYLRCHIIQSLIKKLITENEIHQIINIGCGFDTLFHSILENFKSVKFIDVDFPELLERKNQIINQNVFGNLENYSSVGCDLRDLNNVEALLVENGVDFSKKTLFLAECVLTYVPHDQVQAILSWMTRKFDACAFILYEQVITKESTFAHYFDDAFTFTMLNHFEKLQSSLRNIRKYPTLPSINKRLMSCGFDNVLIHDLGEYWYHWLDNDERNRIASLEMFDEYEEWDVKMGHYFVSLALKNIKVENIVSKNEFKETINRNVTCLDSVTLSDFCELSLPFERWGHTSVPLGNKIYTFGGLGKQRLDDLIITNADGESYPCYSLQFQNSFLTELERPCARVYHASIPINKHQFIVHGGRKSPKDALNDLMLYDINVDKWFLVNTINKGPKRFRHKIFAKNGNIYVIGGLGEDIQNSLWELNVERMEWNCISSEQSLCRFSFALEIFDDKIYVLGGRSSLCPESDTVIPFVVNFTIETLKFSSFDLYNSEGNKLPLRYSHSSTQLWGTSAMLIGGVSKGLNLSTPNIDHSLTISVIDLANKSWINIPRPDSVVAKHYTFDGVSLASYEREHLSMWIGHSLCAFSKEDNQIEVYLMGGGMTCFSMGTFYDKPCKFKVQRNLVDELIIDMKLESSQFNKVDIIGCLTPEHFNQILSMDRPVVIKKSFPKFQSEIDLKKYFKETDLVSIHTCESEYLQFTPRNYTFETILAHKFLDNISQHKTFCYLRSIGENPRKQASDIFSSIPNLYNDLNIEEVFPFTNPQNPRYFSSVFRVSSAGLRLWTHYDIMDNILIHLCGKKTVTLWPPEAVAHLYTQGSSSPVIHFETLEDLVSHPLFSRFKPVQVTLNPGDILVLPSLWFHHVYSHPEVPTLSINVFFKSLENDLYVKKDLYGNRDLAPFEKFQELTNDLIVKHFDKLPEKFKKFYSLKMVMYWKNYYNQLVEK